MALPYYVQRRIINKVIDVIMLILLFFTLFPIGFMIYSSLKDNNDILIGRMGLSRARPDIISMYNTGDKLILFSGEGSISKVNKQTLEVQERISLKSMGTNFTVDQQYIWVSTSDRGLVRIDRNDLNRRKKYDLPTGPLDLSKVTSTAILRTEDKLFIGLSEYKGYEGIMEFSPATEKFERTLTVPAILSPIHILALEQQGGIMWVGSDKGLFKNNIKTGKTEAMYLVRQGAHSVIHHLRSDGSNLWLGTPVGLFVFDINKGQIIKQYTMKEGLLGNNIMSVKLKGEKVYIGTNAGLSILDRRTDKISSNLENLFVEVTVAGKIVDPKAYKPAEVLSSLLDGNRLYLGSSDGRLCTYNLTTKQVERNTVLKLGHIVIHWRNYLDMWKNVNFGLYLRNSFIICGSTMVLAMIFATMAAYSISRFTFPGSRLFSIAILATQMVPGIMFLIPVYIMFVKFTALTGIPLKGTFPGLIFIYSAFFIPFSIWILRGFFAAIPKELEEAATIDGCSPFMVFWYITLPLAIPGIVATGIFVFLNAWDELMFAWVLTNADTMTIPVGIRLFVGNYQNRFDLMMAAATVATIPVMILFFLLQRHIVRGLTAGAVKG